MRRWTIFTLAFASVACSGGERDEVSRGAPDTGASADSAAVADGAGGVGTAGASGADTAARAGTGTAPPTGGTTGTAPGGGPTGAEAMGGVRTGSGAPMPRELSAAQVRQLQAALNDARCNAGVVDGRLGPRTQQAIACGLRKKNLGGNDFAALYRSLNLDF